MRRNISQAGPGPGGHGTTCATSATTSSNQHNNGVGIGATPAPALSPGNSNMANNSNNSSSSSGSNNAVSSSSLAHRNRSVNGTLNEARGQLQTQTQAQTQSQPLPQTQTQQGPGGSWKETLLHKYVLLCLICGGLSVLLGFVLMVIYLILRAHTTSLHYFETVPTYIPSLALLVNGLIVMSLAKRKYRYAYLIKLAGVCCLVCALLCVVITVTTTVVHMNRLQTLHECVYTLNAKSCICVSAGGSVSELTHDPEVNDSSRFVFENTPNCEVVHGSLYGCLRALFGLSVFGILVCIFASMLVYQLLTHEKKKMYFEQLEARRRFQQQHNYRRRYHSHLPPPPPPVPTLTAHSIPGMHSALCNCIEEGLYPGGWFPAPPPPPWDLIDYHSHYRGLEPEEVSTINRSNWLNWPWPQQTALCSPTAHRAAEPEERGFFSRLFRRNPSPVASADQMQTQSRPDSLHWHPSAGTLPPPHALMPRLAGAGFSPPTLPSQLSRQRSNARNRTLPSFNHRRTRSNDGIFQHLHHLSSHPGYLTGSPLMAPPPWGMWGPPPPYSQPSADCNLVSRNNNNNANHHNMSHNNQVSVQPNVNHRRESSIHSMSINGADHCSSKLSTPVSERRMLCNAFSSEGITLTVGNSNSVTTPSKNPCIVEVHVPHESRPAELENCDEVTVIDNSVSSKVPFNTMPTNGKRNDANQFSAFSPNFKSLFNIPLNFNNLLHKDAVSSPMNQIQVYHHQEQQPSQQQCFSIINNSIEEPTQRLSNIRTIYCSSAVPKMADKPYTASSSSSSPPSSSSHSASSAATGMLTTSSASQPTEEGSSSSQSFSRTTSEANAESSLSPPTNFVIDSHTDYKETVNTQSSPLTDKNSTQRPIEGSSVPVKLIYAQSMPNLSLVAPRLSTPCSSTKTTPSHNSRQYWAIHRISSSGNTSTSQDVAELEMDEEPVCFVPELPLDSVEVITCSDPNSSQEAEADQRIGDKVGLLLKPTDYIKPPTPFNTNRTSYESLSGQTSSTLSGPDKKPDNIIVTIRSIQV